MNLFLKGRNRACKAGELDFKAFQASWDKVKDCFLASYPFVRPS